MHNSKRGKREDLTREHRGRERVSERSLLDQQKARDAKKSTSSRSPGTNSPRKVKQTKAEKEWQASLQTKEQLAKKFQSKHGGSPSKPPSDKQTILDKDGEYPAKKPSKFKQLKKDYKNKKAEFRSEWENSGIEKALNNQYKGIGSVLVKSLGFILTPAGSKAVVKFIDTHGQKYLGGMIVSIVALFLVATGLAIALLCAAAMLLILLFAAVFIVLFVPDDRVDITGIDLTGVDGSQVVAEQSGGSTGNTAVSAKGNVNTPEELRGKLLAMYADTTPQHGRWHDPRPGRLHLGVDYDYSKDTIKTATNIYPAAEGVVTKVWKWNGVRCGGGTHNYGYFVDVSHYDVRDSEGRYYVTRYAHLYDMPPVKVGDHVKLDTVIGVIGDTGCSFGEHIHFELYRTHDGTGITPSRGINPDLYLTCGADGSTVEDHRKWVPSAYRYFHTPCFEYSKQMRGLSE